MKVKNSSLFALPNFSSLLREGSETGMAATQLAELADQATRLREKLLELGDFDIPAWAQDHISVACAKLDSVFGYFEYGHLNENDAEDEEKVVTTGEVSEATDEFSVMAIGDASPLWKHGAGHTPDTKVLWHIYGLSKGEVVHAAKMARDKHPKATISVENKSGKIVKVYKPGQAITEADGSAVKPPSEVDRMRTSQKQEKIALQQRQANELMAAKLRDVQQKSREQQMKATAPKSAAKPATR